MAKIDKDEIFDPSLFNKEDAEAYLKTIMAIKTELKKVAKITKKGVTGNKLKSTADLKKFKTDIVNVNKAFNQKIEIDKQRLQVEKQLEIQAKRDAKLRDQKRKDFDKFEKAIEKERKTAENAAKSSVKNAEKKNKAELKLSKDRKKASLNLEKQRQLEIKSSIKSRKVTIDNANAFVKLNKQVKSSRDRFERLAAQHGVNSRAARKAAKAYGKLNARLLDINRSAKKSGGALSRFGGALKSGLGALGIISGVALVASAVRDAGETIVDFDESVADLAKVTGLAKKEARELAFELIKIDTKTSVNELLALATAGGRLGLQGRELIEFTQQTDKAFVALSDSLEGSAEEIGVSLGKIAANFGIEQEFGIGEAINKIGSSLNDLGAKSKANEGRIQDFTNRVGGIAVQAGLALPEVQALGALFDESGQSMEVAASTINKLLPAIGKNVKRFAKVAGLDIETFTKLVSEKPLEALKAVAIGAKSSTKGLEGLSKTLENYGINSARSASIVGILSQKTDRLTELQLIANTAFDEATSLSDEFALKNETLGATFDRLGNKWDKFVISLDGTESVIGNLGKRFANFLSDAITGLQNLDLIWKDTFSGMSKFTEEELQRTLEGGWVTEFGVNISKITTIFDKIPLKTMASNIEKVKEQWIELLGEDRQDATLLFNQYLRTRVKLEKELITTTTDLNKEEEKSVEITLSQIAAQKKRAKELAAFERRLEDLRNQAIEKDLKRQKALINTKFRREIEAIKGNSKVENDLRIELAKARDKKLLKVEEDFIKNRNKLKDDLEFRFITDEIAKKEVALLMKFDEDVEKIEDSQLLNREEKDAAIIQLAIETQDAITKIHKDAAEKRAKDQLKIDKDNDDDRQALADKEAEQDRELAEQRLDIARAFIDKLAEITSKASDKRIAALDDEIQATKDRQDQLREAFGTATLDAKQSLSVEQAKQAKLEQARRKAEEKQERKAAAFKILSALLEQGKNPQEAIFETAALLELFPTLIDALPTFIDGTDGTVADSLGMPHLNTKQDNFVIRVDGEEKILKPSLAKRTGNKTTTEIVEAVERDDRNIMPDFNTYNHPKIDTSYKNDSYMTNKQILNKFDSLEHGIVKAIKGQPVYLGRDYDATEQSIVDKIKRGNNLEKNHKRTGGGLF